MEEGKKSTPFAGASVPRICTGLSYWLIVIKPQQSPATGSMLPALPDSIGAPTYINHPISEPLEDHEENGQGAELHSGPAQLEKAIGSINVLAQKLSDFMDLMIQRDGRYEDACEAMRTAARQMQEATAAMGRREEDGDARYDENRYVDLELQLAARSTRVKEFNWMIGHGSTPRGGNVVTNSQKRFERVKLNVKRNAIWFTDNATDDQLMPNFIQFNSTPRVSVDGFYLKRFLRSEDNVTENMSGALLRVLRYDESKREPDSDGQCHYVQQKWTITARDTAGQGTEDSERLFQQPKLQYSLSACSRVVAPVQLDDGWASISIELRRGITHLIHPAASGIPPQAVRDRHIKLMHSVTTLALTHMVKLGRTQLPVKDWEYEVALQSEQIMNVKDSGVCSAFYSIPKDNQFMIVTPGTITLAKETFVHSLMNMCKLVTRQKIQKGSKKQPPKRDRQGKFISREKSTADQSKADSEAGSSAPMKW